MSENESVLEVKLSEIFADDEFNCREKFEFINVLELAKDIKENGLITPIIIRPLSDSRRKERNVDSSRKYEVVAGFRRFKAHEYLHQSGGKDTVQCLLRPMEDNKAAILNLIENTHREDLTLLEETRGVATLMRYGYRTQEIADKINKSYGWVQNRQRVLQLPPEIQYEANQGTLTMTNIRELAEIKKVVKSDEALLKKAREMKERNFAGKTPEVKLLEKMRKKEAKESKPSLRERTRSEILALQMHIQKCCMNSIVTVILAWAAGEISDDEVQESLQEYYDEHQEQLRPHISEYAKPE